MSKPPYVVMTEKGAVVVLSYMVETALSLDAEDLGNLARADTRRAVEAFAAGEAARGFDGEVPGPSE